MHPKLTEEKEGKGTVRNINRQSEGFWLCDCDGTLDSVSNIISYLHKQKMVCECSGVLFLWRCMCRERRGHQGNRNTVLIKSQGTEMDVLTHTRIDTFP